MHISIRPKKELSYEEALANVERCFSESNEYRQEVRSGRWPKTLYQEIREKHKKKQVQEYQMKNKKELEIFIFTD